MKKILFISLTLLLIGFFSAGAIPKPKNAKPKNARLSKAMGSMPLAPRPETRFK